MYFGDHPPPHFHVEGPDMSVLVEITNVHIMSGAASRSALRPILDWAYANRRFLMRKWDEFHEAD